MFYQSTGPIERPEDWVSDSEEEGPPETSRVSVSEEGDVEADQEAFLQLKPDVDIFLTQPDWY